MQAKRILWSHDVLLIGGMAILAACGLIYEYLIAHYASRIIGAVEITIYAMIGTMIVAMGVGAFLARLISCPYRGFAWLELLIALFGSASILIMAAAQFLAYKVPDQLQAVYGLHVSIELHGSFISAIQSLSLLIPFITGFIVGLLVGMEIPLIARIREQEYQRHLTHNTGTIYGADYIGAGIGAAIWVLVFLSLPIVQAATFTAAANALIGIIFLLKYHRRLNQKIWLWLGHLMLILFLIALLWRGESWVQQMNNALFRDQVLYSKATPYQQLSLTSRQTSKTGFSTLSLFINGRLQFASSDERIYHAYLTTPAMLAAARHDKILIIGGGDGLAVRDLLQWNPQNITLLELDEQMISLFSGKDKAAPSTLSERLLNLNQHAFLDERVEIQISDAFLQVEELIKQQQHFDVIIVDLPDPSHPVLNKLYSDYFYSRLHTLLNGDGVVAIQSTSPYHAKNAFVSIGKTLASAGFNTEQYHANVPSFGEWGWTIGTKYGSSASSRIKQIDRALLKNHFLSKDSVLASFVFFPEYYLDAEKIKVNNLGSNQVYQYHYDAWVKDNGVFLIEGSQSY